MSRREIYRPSQEARDRRDDLEQEWYERVTAEVEAEGEFADVHAEVTRRLAAIKAGNE